MDQQRVRVELLEEQVDLLLELLDKNEVDDENILLHDAWWFSKYKLIKAKNRFKI